VEIGILGYYAGMAKNPEHRDLFPGALEMMILQSLRLRPMHGYALVKHIKQVSEDLLQVEEGSLYPALQRMLKEGLLDVETGISAKGRPTRIYRLTSAGVRHLEREVVSFERMFEGFTRVLAAAKA
jgi:PadR family transcriptional regulator PadR